MSADFLYGLIVHEAQNLVFVCTSEKDKCDIFFPQTDSQSTKKLHLSGLKSVQSVVRTGDPGLSYPDGVWCCWEFEGKKFSVNHLLIRDYHYFLNPRQHPTHRLNN